MANFDGVLAQKKKKKINFLTSIHIANQSVLEYVKKVSIYILE